ncbi:hypothetical protein V2G26_005937 [Clonostachys chloroleuca]
MWVHPVSSFDPPQSTWTGQTARDSLRIDAYRIGRFINTAGHVPQREFHVCTADQSDTTTPVSQVCCGKLVTCLRGTAGRVRAQTYFPAHQMAGGSITCLRHLRIVQTDNGGAERTGGVDAIHHLGDRLL